MAEEICSEARTTQVRKAQRYVHQTWSELRYWEDVALHACMAQQGRATQESQVQCSISKAETASLAWRFSCLSRGASAWLAASPAHPPARVTDREFQEGLALRMGLQFEQGNCTRDGEACEDCGQTPPCTPSGMAHALSCTKRSNKPRHDRIVQAVARAVRKMGPAVAVEAAVRAQRASTPERNL